LGSTAVFFVAGLGLEIDEAAGDGQPLGDRVAGDAGGVRAATGTGTEVQHYTVRLTNANIASINFVMPNVRDANLVKFSEYEEVAFTYQKIEWIWNDGGIMADDDWAAQS